MAMLYIHIPFCRRICTYCDFYRTGSVALLPPLIPALLAEMEQRADYLSDRALSSIYFGGGTPSLLAPEQITQILGRIWELFDCSAVEEITIEANPDDLTEEYVSRLARTAVNRVSLGIQSFDDEALRFMNRRHTAEQAEEAVRRLRAHGIDNISIDIIFGIAGFGGEALSETLRRAIALDVGHISAYHLTVEENTRLGVLTHRGEYTPVDEATSEAEFLAVHRALTEAGYEHYEVSNFAKRGCRARHNSSYWRGVEYLGLGPGAHSFAADNRTWCVSTVAEYVEGIYRYEDEVLGWREHLNEYIMTSLRTAEGLDLGYIASRFGAAAAERIEHAAKVWQDADTLRRDGNRIYILPQKFLLSDAVIESLFIA